MGISLPARFVYGTRPQVPDYMIAVQTGEVYRLLTDHLGSVRRVVRLSDGAIAQELTYDPWGQVETDTKPGFQPFGFAGGMYDPDTHLVRFGARDYDPAIGRWTAKDPSGFAGGTNLYAYADNDPVNKIDLTGENPDCVTSRTLVEKRGARERPRAPGCRDRAVRRSVSKPSRAVRLIAALATTPLGRIVATRRRAGR